MPDRETELSNPQWVLETVLKVSPGQILVTSDGLQIVNKPLYALIAPCSPLSLQNHWSWFLGKVRSKLNIGWFYFSLKCNHLKIFSSSRPKYCIPVIVKEATFIQIQIQIYKINVWLLQLIKLLKHQLSPLESQVLTCTYWELCTARIEILMETVLL